MSERSELMALHMKKEPLCDELTMFIHDGKLGEIIHHPLVIELFYDPERCALINKRYELKKQERDKALADGNWSKYIWIHERPYRVTALKTALERGAQDIHGLISEVWIDSENIWQHKPYWHSVWSNLKDPHLTMDANEKTVYDWMPETVTIHRGIRHYRHWPKGISWTRDKERAVWFAHRWRDKKLTPAVLSAEVSKKDIKAFFMGRGEEEVVVLPRKLKNVTVDLHV